MLWLKVSGLASMTVRIARRSPLKSGVSTSTAQPGTCPLISRIVAAKMPPPPSESSSRFTLVTTACSRPILFAASATRWGSSRSRPVGLPVSTAAAPGGVGGLRGVQLGRLAREYGAEAAGAGADVAEDHERRGPVVPALPDVRATGLLAHRVQVQAAHGFLDVPVDLAVRHPRLEPVRASVQPRGAPHLLPEGQVLHRRAVRRRGDGPVFPGVAHLEGLRAVINDLDVDLSASHGSPLRRMGGVILSQDAGAAVNPDPMASGHGPLA